jgi:signal transduction histidine kinase
MDYRRLGILGITLALLFWGSMLVVQTFIFDAELSIAAALFELIILLAGASLFWWWIARRLRRDDATLRHHAERLAALHRASLAITTEHDLSVVLQTVVDQSRSLIGARYGALGVLNESGSHIAQFITSGMAHQQLRELTTPPTCNGILGIPIHAQEPVRIDAIQNHPDAGGFPPNHPPMHTFLGVPIISKGKIFGNLYLTDKIETDSNTDSVESEAGRFTEEDQSILEMFATQAAIAIENAALYRQSHEFAVLRERERFGMDLHDGVIQSIYAIGLLLDDGLHRLESDPHKTRARLQEATSGLNTVIQDIRRYIADLRSQPEMPAQHSNPLHEFEQLANALREDAALDVQLEIDAKLLRRFTPRQNAELLQIVREAVSNVRRHAQASRLHITLQPNSNGAVLQIRDNGQGFSMDNLDSATGHGLGNMQARAATVGGKLSVVSSPGQGCILRLTVPLDTP